MLQIDASRDLKRRSGGAKTLSALGFPAGYEFGDTPTPSPGSFAGWLPDGDGQWIKFLGLIAGGHSGGPVITEGGGVVGWNVRNSIVASVEGGTAPVVVGSGDDKARGVARIQGSVAVVRGASGINHVRPIEAARPCVEAARGRWEDL